jgi:hypothetical protein
LSEGQGNYKVIIKAPKERSSIIPNKINFKNISYPHGHPKETKDYFKNHSIHPGLSHASSRPESRLSGRRAGISLFGILFLFAGSKACEGIFTQYIVQ